MTENIKIEELLNSYVDGELTVRQRTEVKRMASNDPNIAIRLRQLQKCKMLVNTLPTTQAPSRVLENIKASMEAKAYLNEQKPVYKQLGKVRFILLHRVIAAAAMIAIASALVVITNTFLQDNTVDDHIAFASETKFSGKLEIKASDFAAVNSVINRAIEDNGLSDSALSIKESNRRIYSLSCSKESLDRFLADIEESWNEFNLVTLFVDTDIFAEDVKIEDITPGQISEIVHQTDSNQVIKVARDFAVLNNINHLVQNSGISSSLNDIHNGLIKIPQPVLVKKYDNIPVRQENGEKTVQIRIIVSR